MRLFWIFTFLLINFQLKAQETFRMDQPPAANVDGVKLSSPFAGGINSAQIQTIDLTGDQVEEWVVWDINARQLLVFKKEGDSFIHLPELSYFFPTDISGFLVLADFDGDGKKDLFTSTALGIKAYRNTSNGAEISWEIAQNFLKLDGSGNIQANNLDTPLIQDLDGDGDLDLVIFNFAGGDYMEFYKNTSMERKGSADIDGFAFGENHWGNFEFCGCGDISFGKTCQGLDISGRKLNKESGKILHAGGHSILYQDLDGNGLKDLLLGRDECDILYFLPNSGTNEKPVFTTVSNELPGFGALPEFPIFHIGKLTESDLIIALNTSEQAVNFGIDFKNSVLKINSAGNSRGNFIQDQMIDLGESARPIFLGNKANGELLVTANVLENGQIKSQRSRFQVLNGEFTKMEGEYLNLSQLNLIDAQYIHYQDIDNELHVLASGIDYQASIPTQVVYDLNDRGSDPIAFTGYTPMRGDYLQFYTYEQQDHLLVAAQNGSLDLYTFDFESYTATLIQSDFLGFVDNPANRNLAVAVENLPNPNLYAIDQRGLLVKIENFMNSSIRENVLVKTGEQTLPTKLGRNTWITLVEAPLGGSPDLILGTRAGGLIYLSSDSSDPIPDGTYQFKIYPNPADTPIKVITNSPAEARLINAMGQELLTAITIPANTEVEIQAGFLPPGLYILSFDFEGKAIRTGKFWVR
ncbi:T9SS type A sorting domain-containing protein [Algoriphagus halophytocola]|uniref:T9SS type A sorting domain-containing protein n=1 Tax=Algoriphagus halophytocola TaxID=2991499 RepID=A0ABY6MBN4_9BACT|nr:MULTISPECIES: T9SS type A sorting domain-containing protein [unclassified Algoriphagus]UZD21002.1 T9SS type A sorting domain-containing protein [Algoriphagus sp. TR-M5]WBL42168.1 T9SS type A sorting domain-containing protein [Algoriphagus sp. TR-M9]